MSIELSAIKTLDKLGYTYHGGELWKPPIGEAPKFAEANTNQSANKYKIDRVKERSERIREIAHWFDFKQVADVMKFVGWQWYSLGIPTEGEIKTYCLNTVSSVYDKTCTTNKPQSHNSGGFFVQSHIEDDATISISVKFVLTELDAFTPE